MKMANWEIIPSKEALHDPGHQRQPQTLGKLAAVVCVGGNEAEQVVRH